MKVGDLVTPVGWLAGARGMRKPAMGIVLQINRDLRGVDGSPQLGLDFEFAETGKVEITSQNHGFVVVPDSLPDNVEMTHVSLFDGTLEGIALRDRPVFSVQHHPEASPGPQDSYYLFDRFIGLMESR